MGKITGQGEFKYPSGAVHTGLFVNGNRHGKGKTYAA